MTAKSAEGEGSKLVVYEGRWKLEPSSEADVKFAAATDFTCPVCQDLVWQPLVCEEGCGKLFCRSCTTQWASDKARYTCPACRHKSQPVAISRAVKLLLGKIRVKCPEFQHLGCDWSGGYFDAETHLQQRCQFASIPCPHCLRSVCRRDHAKHADACPQKPIPCADCKQGPFAPAELAVHRTNQCPAMPATCDDCKWAGPRGALVEHIKLCPKVKIMCEIPLCGTMVKRVDMVEHMNQSALRHVQLLLAENLELRNQLLIPISQSANKRQKTGRKRRLAFSTDDLSYVNLMLQPDLPLPDLAQSAVAQSAPAQPTIPTHSMPVPPLPQLLLSATASSKDDGTVGTIGAGDEKLPQVPQGMKRCTTEPKCPFEGWYDPRNPFGQRCVKCNGERKHRKVPCESGQSRDCWRLVHPHPHFGQTCKPCRDLE